MTATAIKPAQAVAEWTQIFPRQVTQNYTSSVTFMKQLTVIAVSTITYLKNAFPEENFTVEQFGGLKLRTLKSKCTDELAQFLSTALTQAFDAFDKKYLHQLALCFYDGECTFENLVEYHLFEYTYKQDGVSMTINSKSKDNPKSSLTMTLENIKEQTVHLIRTCVVMMHTSSQSLTDKCDVSLRLYYNEDAPEGYQAPGFQTAGSDADLGGREDCMKLGRVDTPYHRLVVRTYLREAATASYEAVPSQNPPMMSQPPEEFRSAPVSSHRSSASADQPVRCACNNYDYEIPTALLTCQYCHTQQHATCYGILPSLAPRVTTHCCVNCSDGDPSRRAADDTLASSAARKRDSIAIFRRALELCARADGVSARDLCSRLGLTQLSAVKLMKLLHNQGVILYEGNTDLNTQAKIDCDQLKVLMQQYFQTPEEDIVGRLFNESIASHDKSDPVGEVLSPLERVTLQNTSNFGRVINNIEVNNNNVDDPALKRYRDALNLNDNDDEGLPLSGSHNPVKDVENVGKKGAKRKGKEDKQTKGGIKTKKAKMNK